MSSDITTFFFFAFFRMTWLQQQPFKNNNNFTLAGNQNKNQDQNQVSYVNPFCNCRLHIAEQKPVKGKKKKKKKHG